MKFTDDEPVYECGQCLDEPNGWIALDCTGTTCARPTAHRPHPFAVRCPCWLKRHADQIRRSAETAMSKGQPPSSAFHDLSDLMQGRYVWASSVTWAARQARAREAERRSA